MGVYDLVKELASAKKISVAQLERTLNLSNGSISKWNSSNPNSEPLLKVANYFDVSTDYLLGRTDQPYWTLTEKDDADIEKDLERLIEDLDSGIRYSKEMAEYDDETKELLIASLEQAVRIAKMEAKRKFTPKKHRGGEWWLENFVAQFKIRDPFIVAKERNIIVSEADLGEVYGYYTKIRRIKFIFINKNLSTNRKQFTCAHELGHAILHPDEFTPKLSRLTMVSDFKIEKEANEFATKFLIDESHAEYHIKDKYKMLDFYGIPHEMERFVKWKKHP